MENENILILFNRRGSSGNSFPNELENWNLLPRKSNTEDLSFQNYLYLANLEEEKLN